MPREDLIKLRRGTAAEWESANPILDVGEYGHETDTFKSKIGDGVKPWNDLEYLKGEEYENLDNTDGRLRKYILSEDFDFTSIPNNYDNAIWEIRYIYDLGGNTITMPDNVTLQFNGGRLNNGTIEANETDVIGTLAGFGSDITLEGSIKGENVQFDWFDCERLDSSEYDTFINGSNSTFGAIPTISDKNRIITKMLINNKFIIKYGLGIYPFDDEITLSAGGGVNNFRLLGSGREKGTLLFSPNGNFLHFISGGSVNPFLMDICIEADGSVILTDAGTVNSIQALRAEDSSFRSYNNHCFFNDISITGGTGCPIFGTKFLECTVYAGEGKGCFYGWRSGSNIFDNVVDGNQFFNGVSVNSKGYIRAIFYNSNVRKLTNTNISYSGFDYVAYYDLAGLSTFNAYDNVFETANYPYKAILKTDASGINLNLETKRNQYIGTPSETGFHYIVTASNVNIKNGTDSPTPLFGNNIRNQSPEYIRAVTTKTDSGGTKYRLAYYEPYSYLNGNASSATLLTKSQETADQVGMGSYFAADSANISFIQVSPSLRSVNSKELAWAYGSTSNRPIYNDNVDFVVQTGYKYFDTDIDKPVWWNGTEYVTAEYTNDDDNNGRLRKYILSEDFDFTNIPNDYRNAIWEIRYIYDLNGNDITIPVNVTLLFNGGRLTNYGTITGDRTRIEARLEQIFDASGSVDGFWYMKEVFPEWMGAVPFVSFDSTLAINKITEFNIPVTFQKGDSIGLGITYEITDTISFSENVNFNDARFKYRGDSGKFAMRLFSSSSTSTGGANFSGGFTLVNQDRTPDAPINFTFSKTAFTLAPFSNCTNIAPNAFQETITVLGAKKGSLAKASYTGQTEYGAILLSATVIEDDTVLLNWNSYESLNNRDNDIPDCDVTIEVINNTYHGISLGGGLGVLEKCRVFGFSGVSCAMGGGTDSYSGVEFIGTGGGGGGQCYYWNIDMNITSDNGLGMVIRPRNNENLISLSTFPINNGGSIEGMDVSLVVSGLTNSFSKLSLESLPNITPMVVLPSANACSVSDVSYVEYTNDSPAIIGYVNSSFNKFQLRAQGKKIIDLGSANEFSKIGANYVNAGKEPFAKKGSNILWNGNFNNKINYWTDFSTSGVTQTFVDGFISKNAVRFECVSGRFNLQQNLHQLIDITQLKSRTLTVSGWCRTNLDSRVTINGFWNGRILDSSEWIYFESSYRLTDTQTELKIQLKDPGQNQTGFVEFSDLCLTVGTTGMTSNTLDKDIYGDLTINNGSIASLESLSFDIDVSGADLGDFPIVSNNQLNGLMISCSIKEVDKVEVILFNPTASAIDNPNSTFYATVQKRLDR